MMRLMNAERIEIVDRQMAEILAAKTEAERLQIAWGMWRSARRMLTRLLTSEHPDWPPEDVQREVSRRLASGG
jgi:lauroyl/myristoyl acyltransferase